MKRLLLAVFLLFGCVSAHAQSDLLLMGVGVAPKTSGPAPYVGPGDITGSAIAFYSCGRAYNAAYATAQSAACDLVDTATGLTNCTLSFATNGFADIATTKSCVGGTVTVTTFCTVTHPAGCSVTKMYDQTGTGNHVVQATLANMPGLTLSTQNGLPCAAGTGNAAAGLASAGTISQSAPYTETVVAERTGSFTTVQRILTNDTLQAFSFGATANQMVASNGTAITLTANDSTFHAAIAVASATAPLFAIDSSANISTSSNGTTALTSNIFVMNRAGAQAMLAGFVCEAGIWPADLNSTYQAMLANMRSATNGWNF